MAQTMTHKRPMESATDQKVRIGRKIRESILEGLKKDLAEGSAVLIARMEKIPTRELNQLRYSLQNEKTSFTVVKNSLCRLAFKDLGWEGLEKKVEGTSAISAVRGEVTTVCKLLATFSKDHEGFILQGGLVAGQIVSKEDVNALAKLPARHVLLSQLAGVIQSPLRSLAYLMQAPLRSLVLVLNAVQQRKPAAAPDGEEKAS